MLLLTTGRSLSGYTGQTFALLPTVDWPASTLRKVLSHQGNNSERGMPSTSPPGPSSSTPSSSSVPPKDIAAVEMESKPEDDNEDVEAADFGRPLREDILMVSRNQSL
ncbi:hypothetical protein MLD38_025381 [Melastoma candidum]|uniref:Uncharacterized protein n=1 Tax=Melastoma candidum TaxID=119954 RepID=A0ACB9NVA3_9MYRT|nr:hypothetical protein MLD38_025381 [Melastoma candidum]